MEEFFLWGLAAGFLANGAITLIALNTMFDDAVFEKIRLSNDWDKQASTDEARNLIYSLLNRSYTEEIVRLVPVVALLVSTFSTLVSMGAASIAWRQIQFDDRVIVALDRSSSYGAVCFLVLIIGYLLLGVIVGLIGVGRLPPLIFNRRSHRFFRAKLLACVVQRQIIGVWQEPLSSAGRGSPLAEDYQKLLKICYIFDLSAGKYIPPLLKRKTLNAPRRRLFARVARLSAQAERLVAERDDLVFAPVARGFIGLSEERRFMADEMLYCNFWNPADGEAEVFEVERLVLVAEVPGLNYDYAVAAVLAELDAQGLRTPLEIRGELSLGENARRQLAAYAEKAGRSRPD